MATVYELVQPLIKNQGWAFEIGLLDSDGNFVTNPTLANGDFKISKDGGNAANLAILPVAINSEVAVIVSGTAAEFNCNRGIIYWDDPDDEWVSGYATFFTAQAVTVSDFDETVDQVIVVTNNDKTGYALSVAGVDAILDDIIEGTLTFRQGLRIMFAVLFGKSSGGGTTNPKFRDIGDTKDRVDATTTAAGNRTAVSTDGT